MVESTKAKLTACGYSLELIVGTAKESWVDCVLVLKCDASSELLQMRSIPFYMSRDDFGRLVQFLADQSALDCDDRWTFVTMSLGFQLSILDADEEEATVQALLNVGMDDGNRVYAGCLSQVPMADLRRFSNSVASLEKSVFLS